MSFKKLFLIYLVCISYTVNADQFVYSLKIGESFDSVRGKLNFKWSTTELGWTLISLETIPGAPRYVTNSTLFFSNKKLAGVVFTIEPRISDFNSYEERSKFMINAFTKLSEKFDKKYKNITPNYNESKFVNCPSSKSYDYDNCYGLVKFTSKYKLIELSYVDNKIIMSVASSKQFKKISEMYTNALLSLYASHVQSYLDIKEIDKQLKIKQGISLDEKSFELESAEIEIEYSEVP